jgi:hypothetical protein
MAKLTLNNLTSLTNQTSAITTINNNNDAIETALENTLSRDGTSPNTMGASLDMNSNRILNLPEPTNDGEPLRLGDVPLVVVGSTITAPGSSTNNGIVTWVGTSAAQISSNSVTVVSGTNLSVPGTLTVGTSSTTSVRDRLTSSRTYYVRRDGNDSNSGLTNSSVGAFLTINGAYGFICNNLDLNGQNITVRVQGASVGDGIYNERITTRDWVGYAGSGFGQLTFVGENGTAEIRSTSATATILGAVAETPVTWENFKLTNPNSAGIIAEADDGGLVVLKGCTYGKIGSGGIALASVAESGRILLVAGTHTIAATTDGADLPGTFIYARTGAAVLCQPGVTFNVAGARTFSNAVVDIGSHALFENTGSSFTGTVITGNTYNLDARGFIADTSLITASGTATVTPLAVGMGGTGAISAAAARTSLSAAASGANTDITSLRAAGVTGIGYGTGAGGAVTQLTSKSTGVTLNTACGQITMNNAALASATIVSFTLTNSSIADQDVLILNHHQTGTPGAYTLNAQCGNGSAIINVRNNTAGSLSEAIDITFVLIKGVIS